MCVCVCARAPETEVIIEAGAESGLTFFQIRQEAAATSSVLLLGESDFPDVK